MACKHLTSASLQPPTPSTPVYREDCTQCFDSIDEPAGLDVCLFCFNGGCPTDHNHSALHVSSTGHPLVLNIKRTRKTIPLQENKTTDGGASSARLADQQPPQKMQKLAIAAETESDRYDTHTAVKCYECGVDNISSIEGKLKAVVDGILKASTFARQEEVKAWELDLTACEHTLYVQQSESKKLDLSEGGQCVQCDLKTNLWLCLQCGNLGCGREQVGGVGGNGHGLIHRGESQHPVAVKLGSLTADGGADVYCYACDEERIDPDIAKHLAHWGINIANRQKTEKSLTEMQIEENLRWEFNMTQDGQELHPLFGPNLTGLKNLGNTCYINSTLQALFDIPEFQSRYFHPKAGPPSTSQPAADLETQLRKVAEALVSGKYAKPDKDIIYPEPDKITFQKGLPPSMLKALVGRGHPEFSTMRQQDASEFMNYLFDLISKSTPSQNPVDTFKFELETSLRCNSCQKSRYTTVEQEGITVVVPTRKITGDVNMDETDQNVPKDEYEPVSLEECLSIFTSSEPIDDLKCPSCSSKSIGGFTKTQKFRTFPQVLAVTCHRYGRVNGVYTKLDVPVVVSDAPLAFKSYHSTGPKPGEELLPDEDLEATPTFTPNSDAMSMLTEMGFPSVRCEKALHATGNTDAQAAMDWLMAHMDDADIDVPMNLGGSSTQKPSAEASPEAIEMIGAMGFAAPLARQALKQTGGNVEAAIGWLLENPDAIGDFGQDEEAAQPATATAAGEAKKEHGSKDANAQFQLQSIICHKGTSMHSGHYVAFVKKQVQGLGDTWVLFNDEKVAKAVDAEEMKKFAYIYFFRRL